VLQLGVALTPRWSRMGLPWLGLNGRFKTSNRAVVRGNKTPRGGTTPARKNETETTQCALFLSSENDEGAERLLYSKSLKAILSIPPCSLESLPSPLPWRKPLTPPTATKSRCVRSSPDWRRITIGRFSSHSSSLLRVIGFGRSIKASPSRPERDLPKSKIVLKTGLLLATARAPIGRATFTYDDIFPTGVLTRVVFLPFFLLRSAPMRSTTAIRRLFPTSMSRLRLFPRRLTGAMSMVSLI